MDWCERSFVISAATGFAKHHEQRTGLGLRKHPRPSFGITRGGSLLGFVLSISFSRDVLGHAIRCAAPVAIAERRMDHRDEEQKRCLGGATLSVLGTLFGRSGALRRRSHKVDDFQAHNGLP